MKTKSFYQLIVLLILFTTGCSDDDAPVVVETATIDLINNTFPEYQAEIQETLDDLFQSIQDKDADKLISFHVYGPKFTEFINGGLRVGSAENEAAERGLVDAISGFEYDLNDLKIDVYGEVAKVTFHADFRPVIGGETYQNNAQITLLFVRIDGLWKITHEHNSPLNIGAEGKTVL
ncbi:MAG: nuclear transport factor 2 family protein [Eudoraea sp.]|uniref:YybH family protein n=1 Tax=Eudoraea sp. TaxID=1979955 RepID=UPI003C766B30